MRPYRQALIQSNARFLVRKIPGFTCKMNPPMNVVEQKKVPKIQIQGISVVIVPIHKRRIVEGHIGLESPISPNVMLRMAGEYPDKYL